MHNAYYFKATRCYKEWMRGPFINKHSARLLWLGREQLQQKVKLIRFISLAHRLIGMNPIHDFVEYCGTHSHRCNIKFLIHAWMHQLSSNVYKMYWTSSGVITLLYLFLDNRYGMFIIVWKIWRNTSLRVALLLYDTLTTNVQQKMLCFSRTVFINRFPFAVKIRQALWLQKNISNGS